MRGKKVFITGGTAGLGRAIAVRLAQRGASVMVCARGQAAIDDTVAELRRVGVSDAVFAGAAADVSDAVRMREVATDVLAKLGGLDLLICNTGYAQCRPVVDADDAHFRALMDVNFFGHVNTVRPFLEHFTRQKSGEIVLVASMLAVLSVWGYGAYAASKFAIRGFAEALRQEMLLHGVRVKLFLPPTTDTPGLAKENLDKPAVTYQMESASSLNKTHPVDVVADKLLAWLPKKRFVGYATFDSWFQYFAARHFPELTLSIADGELRTALKALEAKGVTDYARPLPRPE